MGFLDEQDGAVEELIADMAEDAVWIHGGVETAVRAIIRRMGKATKDLSRTVRRTSRSRAVRHESYNDADGVEEEGTVHLLQSELPAGAGLMDRVRIGVSAGSTELAEWVVTERVRDYGNGLVAFAVARYGPRRIRDAETETR